MAVCNLIFPVDHIDGELDGIEGILPGFGHGSRQRIQSAYTDGVFLAA
jgi:hypothetical protein